MPVLAFNGNNMQELNPTEILDYHTTGTSPSMLALRFQSDSLICVDNFTLEKLLNNKEKFTVKAASSQIMSYFST